MREREVAFCCVLRANQSTLSMIISCLNAGKQGNLFNIHKTLVHVVTKERRGYRKSLTHTHTLGGCLYILDRGCSLSVIIHLHFPNMFQMPGLCINFVCYMRYLPISILKCEILLILTVCFIFFILLSISGVLPFTSTMAWNHILFHYFQYFLSRTPCPGT